MEATMISTEIKVSRISIISQRPFEEVVKRLTEAIGHPDMKSFHHSIIASKDGADLEAMVEVATGPIGLMEFYRFDSGEVLSKWQKNKKPGLMRFLIGNPVIMRSMAKTVPDAAAYAPVTVLVHQRKDGVYLSYDLMESLLSPYGDAPALAIARELDIKITQLLEKAAV
ncbi:MULTISPECIES: DUF302 domain-containing protein [Niastella]|uniref:DUF302 domain-containing protein n=1 Tax=Niastella soli TaxID=2821487 RepID=A0ABS3Z2G7_9BACT|nr:DUF302 domain-containing protein [Niastella soli]MBO9204366.1 DUF302 domain-containing protein [Niastella soli]